MLQLLTTNAVEPLRTAVARIVGDAPTEKRLAGGVFWTLSGTAFSRGALLLASLLMARLLERSSYGKFGVVESTIAMFAVLGNMGLTVSTTKLLSQYRVRDTAKAGRILALCILFSVAAGTAATACLVIAAPWLSRYSLASEELTVDLQIGAFVLLLTIVNGALNGALMAFRAFRSTARINVITGMFSVAALVAGTAAAGVRGAVIALLAIQLSTFVLQSVALRRSANHGGISFVWNGCWQERWTLLRFSVPALINSSLYSPVNWLCMALLLNYGGGYSQMGLLQVVNSWFLVILFVPGKLAQVYFPMFEELLADGNQQEAQRLVWKLCRYNLVLFGAGALIVSLAAQLILSFYGSQYAEAAPALIITVWTAAVVASNQPLAVFIIAKSRIWFVVLCSFVWAVLNLLTAYLLVDYGALGIASARLVGYVAYSLLIGVVMMHLFVRFPLGSPRAPAMRRITASDLLSR